MTLTADAKVQGRAVGWALVPLGLMFLAVGLSTALVFPFLSLFLSTAVNAGPVRVTVFLAAAPLAGVVATTLVGRVSDRWPIRRWILVGAAVAGVVGTGLTAFVRDYWVLLALTVTATAAAGALFPQTFAYARQILERDSPAHAAVGISAMRTVFSLAWVAGPPIGALMLDLGGFRLVYGLAAGMYALAALVAFLRLEDVRTQPTPDGGPVAPAPAAGRRTLLLTAGAFVLLQVPLTLGVQALPLFIGEDLHRSASNAGLILGLCAALEIPLMLGLGALTTRFRVRTLILVGGACGVAYYAIALVTPGIWVLAAAQVVNAFFISAVSGVGITYMQDMIPGEPGRATTLFTNTFPIGAVLAGPLFGVAAQIGYRSAYAMGTALCAAGLVLLIAVRPAVRAGAVPPGPPPPA
ncbi:sugar efflux transporter [Dactylosporangium sp. CA-139066]|uniref:sugar efflux transporter n=1 Tax=Dactylosporangium sp. CA-139066 TaxID=3239930 RepID=UPI003D8F86C8